MRYLTCMALLLTAAVASAQSLVLEDFEGDAAARISVRETSEGSVVFKLESDGERGTHLQATFLRGKEAGYAYVRISLTAKLAESAERFDGLTMKVKGDGSRTFGLVEIRSDDYVNTFQGIFPLDSTEWRTVSIRWDEFFQINDGTREAPIHWDSLNIFAFGSRARWGSSGFAVDDVALARIERREPRVAPEGARGLSRSVGRLKEGGKLKIVALGDSITWGTKVPREKRSEALYFQLVAAGLEKAFAGARVETVNAGVGGDTIAEGLVRVGHEVAVHEPDMVIVLLGANNAFYDATHARVRATMSLLVEKLLETTDAEILLLGPTPIKNKPGLPQRYGRIYSEIAAERNVAFFDLSEVLALLAKEDFESAYADNVHLSEYGHRVIGEAVLEFLTDQVRSTTPVP